uniref:Conserved domain protein n=1 Tax=Rhabditophanes sp. KR3021 TaxID=114890 RepID=A0AC35TQL8_9BILA
MFCKRRFVLGSVLLLCMILVVSGQEKTNNKLYQDLVDKLRSFRETRTDIEAKKLLEFEKYLIDNRDYGEKDLKRGKKVPPTAGVGKAQTVIPKSFTRPTLKPTQTPTHGSTENDYDDQYEGPGVQKPEGALPDSHYGQIS